ncbi:2'-5' RNA ligase [Palleronia aestuarii]|uniref:RNA 2',3'-cyclic phosphodiesterase n=1 Tax=Palleronia aestuarii TaxID=568105 RepID=A0A2W7N8E7_9RHOB|nr:RNA 2',3'-cyclic phosphodiesterase [Palleronia aestuarii]PZX16310.1 2'-5' RNA ligase [Palleronia aestuarii]
MRAFLALDLPEELTAALATAQEGIRAGRVVPEEDLHLTLAFLGEVRLDALDDLVLDLEMLRPGPIRIEAAGLEMFGGPNPSSLHIRVDAAPELLHLQRKTETMIRRAGLALPRRRFVPHVTLARFPRTMSAEDHARLGRFLAAKSDLRLPPVWSDSLSLMQSRLTSEGPIYDPIETFALA